MKLTYLPTHKKFLHYWYYLFDSQDYSDISYTEIYIQF